MDLAKQKCWRIHRILLGMLLLSILAHGLLIFYGGWQLGHSFPVVHQIQVVLSPPPPELPMPHTPPAHRLPRVMPKMPPPPLSLKPPLPKAIPPVSTPVSQAIAPPVDKEEKNSLAGQETSVSDKPPVGDSHAVEDSHALDETFSASSLGNEDQEPPPYTLIRTQFSVFLGDKVAGEAEINYEQKDDRYHLDSLIKPKGLLALFIPSVTQISEGKITPQGLQPEHYRYQVSGRPSKNLQADFDWQTLRVQLNTGTVDLSLGTQDLLSFMYQFMFVPPMQNLSLLVGNGKKISLYDYGLVGTEKLNLSWGEVDTWHIARLVSDDDETRIDLWLAEAYRFVPLKLRKIEKSGRVYELIATTLDAH